MLPAMVIFSRRLILSCQMKMDGNTAKKKSAIMHATVNRLAKNRETHVPIVPGCLPPRVTANGVISMSHRLLGRSRGSQMPLDGRHWTQNMMAVRPETNNKAPITDQMATLCQRTATSRSRNKPMDAFATAIPMTANVCPTISILIAFANSSSSSAPAF